MNKKRKQQIKNIIKQLQNQSVSLKNAQYQIEQILDKEQDAYDNTPENLLYSERAGESEFAIDCLEEALDLFDDSEEENIIDEIIDLLEVII